MSVYTPIADLAVPVEMHAEPIHNNEWVVRPAGQLGTVGFYPVPWTAQFVYARDAREAIRKARPLWRSL